MSLTLVDMTWNKHAQALTSLSTGTQALVKAIIDESNSSKIMTAGGGANKQAFYNHSDDRDPASQGGKAAMGTNIGVYYMPSNRKEFNSYEVIDKAVGLLSGRRRLVVRTEGGKTAFYTTSHPREKPGLRTNTYGTYTPIDTTR